MERAQRWAKRASTFNGAFDLGRDVNNPLDTNYAYANALAGVYRSYSESDARRQGHAFARPAVGMLGNIGKYNLRGPGINNWDARLYKNVIFKDHHRLQLRVEAFNVFDHTQFDGLDTTARFDAAGNELNSRLGQTIFARNPRHRQLALKFIF